MGFAKYREELEQKKKEAAKKQQVKKTGFAAYREQLHSVDAVSPLEATKSVISAIPETSTSLSSERARSEKIALKNPEKYAAAKELSDRLQSDKKFAAEYEAQRAAREEWDGLLSTDVPTLEKELAALEASRPVYQQKQGAGYNAREYAIWQAESVGKNKEIDEKVAALEKRIFDAKMAQAENTYSLIPKRSDFVQYSSDEKHKGENLYDSVFGGELPSPDELNLQHRKNYDAIVAEYGEDSEEAEDYLLTWLDNGVAPTIANADSMTEEERNTFRYILNKEGEKEATDYLGFIQERVNARAAQANIEQLEEINKNSKGIFKWLNEEISPVVHSYFTGMGNIGVGENAGVRNPISGAMATTKSQFVQSAMREDEDTGWIQGALMDTASAIGMMTPSMIIGAFNPALGKLAMSTRIFSDSTNSSLQEGKSLGDSLAYGVTNGAIEYVTQTYLGGIKNLSNQTLAKKMVPAIDKALSKTKRWVAVAGRTIGNTVGNVKSEAFEEWLQSALDPIVRNVIFDENNEVNPFSSDALYEGLIGGITALFLGGTPSASKQEDINRIVQSTSHFTSESVVEKRNDLARRMHEDVASITDKDINDLYVSVAEEIMETASLEEAENDTGAAAIRESLSREAQGLLDGVLAMEQVTDKDAAVNIFEINYLKGYLGKEFEFDGEARISAETQRAAFELGRKAKTSLGTVTIESGTKVSEEFKAFSQRLAKELHTHISIGGKAPVKNGVQSRGYSTKYGELHIYEDAQVKFADGTTLFGEDAARVIILGHEVTHRLQQLAPREYEEFADLALKARAGETGIYAYRVTGGYGATRAVDEIAADYAMSHLFTDERTISEVTKKRSKLAEVIRNILTWIKEKLGIKTEVKEIDRAIRLWNDAYNASRRNARSEKVHNKNAVTEESGVKWSRGDIKDVPEIVSFVKDSLSRNGNQKPKEIGDISSRENSEINKFAYTHGDGYRGKYTGGKHTVDAAHIRHAKNTHSDIMLEALRAQLPLTEDDIIATLSAIANGQANIAYATRGAKGEESIIQEVAVNGYTLYAEEIVRNGKEKPSNLEGRTMYKTPTKTTAQWRGTSPRALPRNLSGASTNSIHQNVNLSTDNFLLDGDGKKQTLYVATQNGNPIIARSVDGLIFLSADKSNISSGFSVEAVNVKAKKPFYITSDNAVYKASNEDVAQKVNDLKAKGYDCFIFDYHEGDRYAVMVTNKAQIVKKSEGTTKESTSATDELGEALEEIAKREEYEAMSVARRLVETEYAARADGKRYNMSFTTFEQVARQYTEAIADEEQGKKFLKKLFDATVNIAAAWRSRGDTKAAYYDDVWRGMKSAARILESDKEAATGLAEMMLVEMLESGYAGRASTMTERDVFMTTRQAQMDDALSKGRKVSLSEVVLRRENFKKDEKIKNLLKDNKELREKADELHVRSEVQKEWREKYSKFKEEYHENDTVQKRRERIEKNMAALHKWATNPDKQGHSIPDAARMKILEIFSRVEMQKGEGATLHNIKWRGRIEEISNAICDRQRLEKLIENGTNTINDCLPIGVINKLYECADRIGEGNVYEMRGEELQALDEALCVLKKNLIDANDIILDGRKQEIKQVADEEIQRLKTLTKSKTKKFVYDYMDSFTYTEEVGGLVAELMKKMRGRFDTFITALGDVVEFSEKTVKPQERQAWRKSVKEITLGGQKVYVTDAQLISLYLLSRREAAKGHLYGVYDRQMKRMRGGGIQIDHRTLKASGDAKAKGFVGDSKETEITHITEEEVRAACNLLSTAQKKFAESLSKFMSDVLGTMGNEVSMKMYGYRAFGELHYFPMEIAGRKKIDVTSEDIDSIFSVMNPGMAKALTQGANNPLVLYDAFEVFEKHVSEMLNYYAYAEVISDSMRVLNYSPSSDIYAEDGGFVGTKMFEGKNLSERLEETFPGAAEFFKNQIRAFNKQKAFGTTELDSLLSKATSMTKSAQMGMNLRVISQQHFSYYRTLAMIDLKNFVKGYSHIVKRVPKELIFKYCPIAQWKSWGFYETDIGPSLDSLLFGERNLYDKAKDLQMKPAGKIDDSTLKMIWRACEGVVRDQYKNQGKTAVGEEEFYREVGRLCSQVIDETQVVDSPLHRVQAARSKDGATKWAMSYTSEPMKELNMWYRARKRGGKTLAQTSFVLAVSTAITLAIASAVDAFIRDDDDDEDFGEKYKDAFLGNILQGLNPLSRIPAVGDDVSAYSWQVLFKITDLTFGTNLRIHAPKAYGSSRFETAAVDSIDDLISKLENGAGWYDIGYTAANTVSLFTGLGLGNVWRDFVGGTMNILNGFNPSPKGAYKRTLASGNTEKAKANYNAFLNAKCEELAKSKYGKEYSSLPSGEKKKIRSSAQSSIRTTTKNLFDDSYIKAWKKGDDAAITRIRGTLIATDIYGMEDIKEFFASFVKSYYKEQYKKAKSEADKYEVIKEAANAKGRLIGDFRIFKNFAEAKKYLTS